MPKTNNERSLLLDPAIAALKVMTVEEWCELNGFSVGTGTRAIRVF
jgi:hypothetical protein